MKPIANKGTALKSIQEEKHARAAMFVGDDRTDEEAFAAMSGPDIAVKVGNGPTRAALRAIDVEQVADLLFDLYQERRAFLG